MQTEVWENEKPCFPAVSSSPKRPPVFIFAIKNKEKVFSSVNRNTTFKQLQSFVARGDST